MQFKSSSPARITSTSPHSRPHLPALDALATPESASCRDQAQPRPAWVWPKSSTRGPLTKVAGNRSANYLCTAPCQAGGISLGFGLKADLRSW